MATVTPPSVLSPTLTGTQTSPTASTTATGATTTPCTLAWSSLTTDMPTPPSALVSWYVSLFTATDFTTTLTDFHATPPASLPTVASAAVSYTSVLNSWSQAHNAQLASISASCPGLAISAGLWDLGDSNVWSAVSADLPPGMQITVGFDWPPSLAGPTGSSGGGGSVYGSGPSSSSSSSPDGTSIALIVLGIVLGLSLLSLFWWCVLFRRRRYVRYGAAARLGVDSNVGARGLRGVFGLAPGKESAPPADMDVEGLRPGREMPEGSEWRRGRRREDGIQLEDVINAARESRRKMAAQSAEDPPPPAYVEEENDPFIPRSGASKS